jgi:8-oxo-dGTP pyrophosphatase MutT (NUDIX family)
MTPMPHKPPFLVPHPVHGHLEYLLPVSSKTVIDHHGRIPLLRNEREEWELPGGKAEPGESLEDTARREELGLDLGGLTLAHAWIYEITPIRHVLVIAYATAYTGRQIARCSNEHKALELFRPEEIRDLRMPEAYKTAIGLGLDILRSDVHGRPSPAT